MTGPASIVLAPGRGVACGRCADNPAVTFARCPACFEVVARCGCEDAYRAARRHCRPPWEEA